MGPGPHQPRALIGQRRQLDLQAALMGARPRAEDLQDQAGAVDHLGIPAFSRLRCCTGDKRAVDDDELDSFSLSGRANFDRAAAEQASPGADAASARSRRRRRPDRWPGQADRFGQPRFERRAWAGPRRARCDFEPDERRARGRSSRSFASEPCPHPVQASSLALSASNSWIGCAGITVEIACL